MNKKPELKVGLEGVAVAETKISYVDGENGKLIYRGELVENLVKNATFEEIVYLLWEGKFPTADEKKQFTKALAEQREIPVYLKDILTKLPKDMNIMSVLRTGISALVVTGENYPPTRAQAMRILAIAPTIVAYFYNYQQGKKEIAPDPTLNHVANYLYMLTGKVPDKAHERALETYLMLSADHDINASSFTARVVTSTQADIISAIVAAISALKGPLHGGAPSEVEDMLDEIGSEENIEPWLRNHIESGKRIMGFGHRVYKTYDPRAVALKKVVQEYAKDNRLFKLSLQIEEKAIQLLNEYKPGRKLYTNVEFWAAGVLRTIELPRSLYTPTFCTSRIAGWCAQIMEQASNNRLIRPAAIYVGPMPK